MLLELITRKKARDDDGLTGLVERFTQAIAKGIKSVREMFDADIAIPNNIKTIEEVAKLSGKCLKMELHKRPEMLEVAESLRKLRKPSQQGRERLALFSWGRKNKLAPGETASSQESSSSSHSVGISAPAESTTSEESSSISSTRNGGTFMTSLFVLEDLLRALAPKVLGKGTIGTTYKGKLESGYTLVVKRLRAVNLPTEEFNRRVAVISAIQNKHIAPLQWYYCSNDEKLIVYDFFPMGSLAHVLHDPVPRTLLGWDRRVAIALAAASGVAFIHSARPSSCHGNIKSSNVMLTGTHDACVSEHGLITLVLFPRASVYSAPEITKAKRVSQKADVYNFGVLLLELLTGKDPVENTRLEDGVNLLQWVRSVPQDNWAAEVIDVQLLGHQQKDGDEECMVRLLQLAIHCCREDANSRPTMSDVVQQIEKLQA